MLFASILLGASVLAGCAAGEASDAPAVPPAPEVTTAVVETQELREWADFTGRLEAVENVAVRPRVGGYVESVEFTEGARVAQGDLLFQIDPRPFDAEVARLTAERDRARAEVELAHSYRERAERLLAQNATSREEFEQLAADSAVAKAKLGAAEAALDIAQLNLSFTRVTAPIAGRVSRAVVTAGNLVDGATLLTTVVSDSPVYAYFDIDEQTLSRARARLPMRARMAARCTSVSSTSTATRTLRGSTSSTTRSIPTTARFAHARCSTTRTGNSCRGCSCASSS